ncbi:hypothetical protein [Cysteiniphilum marinum]|uniref:hypothetical protein n=1 Tax=Cysteiniphilum marinum TaxID=2774191 RepID=UPI00193929AE|nr:hypothetical protein [Cysteiniphilum marinum]
MSLLIRMFKYSIGLWLLGSVINVAAVFVFARACRQWNWLDPSLYRVYMPTLEKICGYWLVAPFFVFASIGLVAFVLWVLSTKPPRQNDFDIDIYSGESIYRNN